MHNCKYWVFQDPAQRAGTWRSAFAAMRTKEGEFTAAYFENGCDFIPVTMSNNWHLLLHITCCKLRGFKALDAEEHALAYGLKARLKTVQ